MPKLDPQFLDQLETALSRSGYAELAGSVRAATVHSFTQEGRQPMVQFIYLADKDTLPRGSLQEIILEVPGLFCAFAHDRKIVALELLGRNVVVTSFANEIISTAGDQTFGRRR